MAKQKLSFDEIMELADQYGVKDNVLFVSAADPVHCRVNRAAEDRSEPDGIAAAEVQRHCQQDAGRDAGHHRQAGDAGAGGGQAG